MHPINKWKRDLLLSKVNELGGKQLQKDIAKLLKEHPEAEEPINAILTINRFSDDNSKTLNRLNFLISSLEEDKSIKKFNKELANELNEILSKIVTEELEKVQSARMGDVFIPQSQCFATDYARILSNFIIDDQGNIDNGALTAILSNGIVKSKSFVHDEHVIKMLKKLQEDLGKTLLEIRAPKKQNSNCATFIRMTIGKNINDPLTDVDTRRAVVTCLLDELYQEDISGSCYTTSLAMNIRSNYPELFINDMENIINHGYYTRTIDGKPYLFFPMMKALDKNLQGGILKKRTLLRADKELIRCRSLKNRQTKIDDDALFSLINAFKSAGIITTPEEIIEITNALSSSKPTYTYVNEDKETIPIDESQVPEYLEKTKQVKSHIVKHENIPLKEIIKLVLLNRFKLSLPKIKEDPLKREEYAKLKNWVQQSFSNNRINRLLRSWEYSIGTATLDTLRNTKLQYEMAEIPTYAARQILALFNLQAKFEELQNSMSKDDYKKFLNNFYRVIDNRVGFAYSKGRRVFFDKADLLDYDDKKKISSLKDLQKLVSSIITEAGNGLLEHKEAIATLAEYVSNDDQKGIVIKILQNENNSKETDSSKLLKRFLAGGSLLEPVSNYCGKTIMTAKSNSILPNTAEDLLSKLISEIKVQFKDKSFSKQSLEEGSVRIPVAIDLHAFSLVLNQKIFQDAVEWRGPIELFLEKNIKAGETVIIADLNYIYNDKHVYLGVQKTNNNQYKLVETLDTESLFSGHPEILSNPMTTKFLGMKWLIYPKFHNEITDFLTQLPD